LSGSQEEYETTPLAQIPVDLEFLPADLTGIMKKGEEMTYTELSSYIKDVEAEGYDATSYKVDLRAKIAFPFICVIMCIVGTGLALRKRKREGLAGSIFLGIVVAFLYWTVYSFSLSLGYGGVLPPVIAAWLANVTFTGWGVYVLLSSN
jgi:lipopolysaccharide export system permease protein